MWSFYKNKQYRNALIQSDKVIENKSFDHQTTTDATYAKPRAIWPWAKEQMRGFC